MVNAIKIGLRRVVVTLSILAWCTLSAQNQPIQYFYDDLGRLVTVVSSDGSTVITYAYDAVGNILYTNRSTVTKNGRLAIYGFNPEQGPVSTPVTIYGGGFSTNPAQDLVKFNGVVATVTSATTSTLRTSVPAGATTGPISVTVGGRTVTSSQNFVVTQAPVLQFTFPKSALFNVVVPNIQITGGSLTGATFSFNAPGPTVSNVLINSSGTAATMTFSAGSTAAIYALVATTLSGNSILYPVPANRFTVVDPASTFESDGDTWPDAVEATYGTDPLDPNSHPTLTMPTLQGELDSLPPTVLNTAPPHGSQEATIEVDAIFFSVCNSAQPPCPTLRRYDALTAPGIPLVERNIISSGDSGVPVSDGSRLTYSDSVGDPESIAAQSAVQKKEGGGHGPQSATPK